MKQTEQKTPLSSDRTPNCPATSGQWTLGGKLGRSSLTRSSWPLRSSMRMLSASVFIMGIV